MSTFWYELLNDAKRKLHSWPLKALGFPASGMQSLCTYLYFYSERLFDEIAIKHLENMWQSQKGFFFFLQNHKFN